MLFLDSSLGPLLPEHWSELIVGIILMAIIIFVVTKYVVPKFDAMYEQRTAQIEGGINRAQKVQLEAQETKRKLEQQLASSREESAKIRQQAKDQADQIIADAKLRAQKASDQMIAQARSQIAVEQQQAFAELKSDVGALALQLAERILGESLQDSDRASRTVDDFIAELANQPTVKVPDYPPEGL